MIDRVRETGTQTLAAVEANIRYLDAMKHHHEMGWKRKKGAAVQDHWTAYNVAYFMLKSMNGRLNSLLNFD